ncbi:helix-turn-helix domain-containing protein [Nonomuraea cypriaca]|uniref:helix-turn-helix domain-containing protein n=1 Tax=Nonomuraea cypriaca TaxID=1187855 RepID=UPI002E28A8ED|nr:MerR family transcriptional regulator [Nonomuraea cypriaca]
MAWSTRELAELAGTTVNTIRHYHRLGLLDEPERRYNGYKQYGVQDLVRLLRLRRLVELGMPLAQIGEVGAGGDSTPDALRQLDTELAARPLLDLIHRTPAAVKLLIWPFDFDVSRTDHVEVVKLASGDALEAVAGDGAGGTFFLCGNAAGQRPVLYADSEGQAGPIGRDLPTAIQLIVRVPCWRDCLARVSDGLEAMRSVVPELEREYADNGIDLDVCRTSLAGLLTLDLPPMADVLARLLETVTLPGFVLLTEWSDVYEPIGR